MELIWCSVVLVTISISGSYPGKMQMWMKPTMGLEAHFSTDIIGAFTDQTFKPIKLAQYP